MFCNPDIMYSRLLQVSSLCVTSAACCTYIQWRNDVMKLGNRNVTYPVIPLITHCESKATADGGENWDYNWDKREEEMESVTATRTLILIRHGQYVYEDKDEERVLTELGRKQAREVGVRLIEMNLSVNRIIHSDLTRAVETAGIIATELHGGIPTEMCSMLREGKPYRPEPDFIKRKEKYYFIDGARIEAAFRKYFYRAGKENTVEIIVGHGNVFRYFVCRVLQLNPDAWLRISLGNCSITVVTIRGDGRVCLEGLGMTGHLPVGDVTYK